MSKDRRTKNMMPTEGKVMQVIREDMTISQEIKDYLQWVFSKRSAKDFFYAVAKTLGYIPF